MPSPMDYGSSWGEPQAAPPPVHHHHHHLYYAPPPYVHHPDVIQHHQQPQPSSSTAGYYYPNPNPNHYHTPTHDAPLPSAAGAGALRPPSADTYAPCPYAAHGGYDGLHAVPYSYPGAVPPPAAAAAGVGGPSAYYYGGGGEDPHSLAVKEAVRQYGVDPHSYGPVLARSSNGLEPAAPPQVRSLHLHGGASHLTSEKTKKRGRKKVTKVVQSAYCEVCKIECNTPEVLKSHKQGKKHKKTLQKLQESITANHSKAPKATVERKEIPDAEKSKTVGEKAKQKGAPASAEELEAKKRRVLEGGAAAEGVKVCTICNVVVNSEKVFEYHVAGQKHAAMVKKLQEQEVAAASDIVKK
ncbi:zinc finger RNA-binding protein-like [Phoenix dactylifera]|uniref:Zinc finger RNA-binding protein-like n=1 Tax=Phoenix dactylifera TaxID=42345 RepID=A0A8B7C6L1_PHODC|nr:zinc finger RNA-binding protein-like [Phoenix dactylifera]